MKPYEAHQQYNESSKSLEKQYLLNLIPWILEIKPGAKQFEFEGYQEGNDEGGSYYCFYSLFIDEDSLEDLVSKMSLEKVRQLFTMSNYWSDEKLNSDPELVWDAVRDNLDFPEFVYDHRATEIPQE